MKIMNGNSREQGRYFFFYFMAKIYFYENEKGACLSVIEAKTKIKYMKTKSSSEACLGLRVFQMFLWREVE